MKKMAIILVLALVLAFAGCNEPEPKGDGNGKEGDFTSETIQEVLAKAENIDNIYYDSVMTVNGIPMMTVKYWIKGKKVKTELIAFGQTTTAIYDSQYMYTYDPQTDMYLKIEQEYAGEGDIKSLSNQALQETSLKEIKKEKVDGKNARVVEFTVIDDITGEEQEIKAWFWEKHGILLKMEVETSQGKMGMEIKDIEIGSVQDSVFEVPEDKIQSRDGFI